MNISRTFDVDLVKSVMESDGIWETIAEDGQERGTNVYNVETECWLTCEDDGELVALYNLTAVNNVTVDIHAHVLPHFRKVKSEATGKGVLAWLIGAAPQYKKVIANVPECFPNVIDFCERMGFVKEGVNRKSYMKDGKIQDLINLGITREEIEAIL